MREREGGGHEGKSGSCVDVDDVRERRGGHEGKKKGGGKGGDTVDLLTVARFILSLTVMNSLPYSQAKQWMLHPCRRRRLAVNCMSEMRWFRLIESLRSPASAVM